MDNSAAAAPRTLDDLGFDPQWCLFWAHNVTGFHLDIWLPYLRRSRYRFGILSARDGFSADVRARIAEVPNVRILDPYDEARVWLRGRPSLRGFLYIGTRQENFAVVNGFGSKSHVWLGHGESDKLYNAFRTASLYDSMFVARYGVVHRYPRAIRRWVASGACAIGTPILDGAVKDPWTSPRPIRRILYAPTWEGHIPRADYSSLGEVGPALLAAMPALRERGIGVTIRPHPTTGIRRPELRELRDALFDAGAERGTAKAADFTAADLMISDISGVSAEFLFTEKPVIMPTFERLAGLGKDDTRLAAEYPWAYRWSVADESLVDRLTTLEGHDPLRKVRASAANEMFRGHRSIEAAVDSFDLALASVRWRKTRVPVRWAYELKRTFPILRNRRLGGLTRRLRR